MTMCLRNLEASAEWYQSCLQLVNDSAIEGIELRSPLANCSIAVIALRTIPQL